MWTSIARDDQVSFSNETRLFARHDGLRVHKVDAGKYKIGLQPVSRPVERVHYLGGGVGVCFGGKKRTFRECAKECSKTNIFLAGKKSRISTPMFKTHVQNE